MGNHDRHELVFYDRRWQIDIFLLNGVTSICLPSNDLILLKNFEYFPNLYISQIAIVFVICQYIYQNKPIKQQWTFTESAENGCFVPLWYSVLNAPLDNKIWQYISAVDRNQIHVYLNKAFKTKGEGELNIYVALIKYERDL